jgi:hypothetical protein
MTEENRPHLCFDKDCKIIFNSYNKEYVEKGYSYFCFGKLKEPHKFTEKECVHVNDYCHCVYTPLKGVLRFFINEGDAWIYQLGMCGILNNAKPLVCDECGPVNRVSSTVIHFGDGSKLCPECAVRLGKKAWHPEEKKYW